MGLRTCLCSFIGGEGVLVCGRCGGRGARVGDEGTYRYFIRTSRTSVPPSEA